MNIIQGHALGDVIIQLKAIGVVSFLLRATGPFTNSPTVNLKANFIELADVYFIFVCPFALDVGQVISMF